MMSSQVCLCVQCVQCKTYQAKLAGGRKGGGQRVEPPKSFSCSMCGSKQSGAVRVVAVGSAAEIRMIVQAKNAERIASEEKVQSSQHEQFHDHYCDTSNHENGTSHEGVDEVRYRSLVLHNKYEEYLGDEDDNDDENHGFDAATAAAKADEMQSRWRNRTTSRIDREDMYRHSISRNRNKITSNEHREVFDKKSSRHFDNETNGKSRKVARRYESAEDVSDRDRDRQQAAIRFPLQEQHQQQHYGYQSISTAPRAHNKWSEYLIDDNDGEYG